MRGLRLPQRASYTIVVLIVVYVHGLHSQTTDPQPGLNSTLHDVDRLQLVPFIRALGQSMAQHAQHAQQQQEEEEEEMGQDGQLAAVTVPVHQQRGGAVPFGQGGGYSAECFGADFNISRGCNNMQGLPLLQEEGQQYRRAVLQALGAPAWRGRFDATYGLSYFAPYLVFDSRYANRPWLRVVSDPTDRKSRQPVMRITFKKGGWSGRRGGTLFYASPFGKNVPIARQGARLEYDVYFPPNFDFVKGGKLPGLASGRGCGGGASADSCWSVRLMWRREGEGEAYLYLPRDVQHPSLCKQRPYTICDPDSGISLSRGAFRFTPGAWHRLGVTVQLNRRPDTRTGSVEVTLDGKRVIFYNKINYRKRTGINVHSVYFASWFGGGDASWAPSRGTFLLFRNIRLYQLDPRPPIAAIATANAVFVAALQGQSLGQEVEVEDTGEPW